MTLAHVEDNLAGAEIARGTTREALSGLDLRRIEDGKQLVVARLDETHTYSPVA
jgi:hypothetical protein